MKSFFLIPFLKMKRRAKAFFLLFLGFFFLCEFRSDGQKNSTHFSSLKFASWNLEHFMSQAKFEQWKSYCSLKNWQEDQNSPPEIPYCDALDGRSFPDLRLVSLPLHDWESYLQKVQALKKTASKIDADIFAVQEVTDVEALKLVFDSGVYDFFMSSYPHSQNLGFVVKKKWKPLVQFQGIDSFALEKPSAKKSNRLRPGVEMTIHLPQGKIAVLNLHLKSGCKNYRLDAPEFKKDWEKRKKKEIQQNCQTLRKQIPLVKDWIQSKKDQPFLLLGDFNRDFFWEFTQKFQYGQKTRLFGSDSLESENPITDKTKIGLVFFEWSAVPNTRLILSRFDQKKKSKKNKNFCRFGDDHMIWNQKFVEFFRPKEAKKKFEYKNYAFPVQKIGYGPENYGKDKATPSDHCVLFTEAAFDP